MSTPEDKREGEERFSIPFKFNFTNTTSRHANYEKSTEFLKALKSICREVKLKDNKEGIELDL